MSYLGEPTAYQGDLQNGLPDGKGRALFPGGVIYEGDWSAGKLHGFGILRSKEGMRYEGHFKQGLREGWAIHSHMDGAVFIGEYHFNKAWGRGFFYYSNGDLYVGEWKDDYRHGVGLYKNSNGDRYEGQWSRGKENGSGKYTYADNDTYCGHWKDGSWYGYGVYFHNNGDLYEGEFLYDARDGLGVLSKKDGRREGGRWSADVFVKAVDPGQIHLLAREAAEEAKNKAKEAVEMEKSVHTQVASLRVNSNWRKNQVLARFASSDKDDIEEFERNLKASQTPVATADEVAVMLGVPRCASCGGVGLGLIEPPSMLPPYCKHCIRVRSHDGTNGPEFWPDPVPTVIPISSLPRCSDCGGFGVDLVGQNGLCNHCTRRQSMPYESAKLDTFMEQTADPAAAAEEEENQAEVIQSTLVSQKKQIEKRAEEDEEDLVGLSIPGLVKVPRWKDSMGALVLNLLFSGVGTIVAYILSKSGDPETSPTTLALVIGIVQLVLTYLGGFIFWPLFFVGQFWSAIWGVLIFLDYRARHPKDLDVEEMNMEEVISQAEKENQKTSLARLSSVASIRSQGSVPSILDKDLEVMENKKKEEEERRKKEEEEKKKKKEEEEKERARASTTAEDSKPSRFGKMTGVFIGFKNRKSSTAKLVDNSKPETSQDNKIPPVGSHLVKTFTQSRLVKGSSESKIAPDVSNPIPDLDQVHQVVFKHFEKSKVTMLPPLLATGEGPPGSQFGNHLMGGSYRGSNEGGGTSRRITLPSVIEMEEGAAAPDEREGNREIEARWCAMRHTLGGTIHHPNWISLKTKSVASQLRIFDSDSDDDWCEGGGGGYDDEYDDGGDQFGGRDKISKSKRKGRLTVMQAGDWYRFTSDLHWSRGKPLYYNSHKDVNASSRVRPWSMRKATLVRKYGALGARAGNRLFGMSFVPRFDIGVMVFICNIMCPGTGTLVATTVGLPRNRWDCWAVGILQLFLTQSFFWLPIPVPFPLVVLFQVQSVVYGFCIMLESLSWSERHDSSLDGVPPQWKFVRDQAREEQEKAKREKKEAAAAAKEEAKAAKAAAAAAAAAATPPSAPGGSPGKSPNKKKGKDKPGEAGNVPSLPSVPLDNDPMGNPLQHAGSKLPPIAGESDGNGESPVKARVVKVGSFRVGGSQPLPPDAKESVGEVEAISVVEEGAELDDDTREAKEAEELEKHVQEVFENKAVDLPAMPTMPKQVHLMDVPTSDAVEDMDPDSVVW